MSKRDKLGDIITVIIILIGLVIGIYGLCMCLMYKEPISKQASSYKYYERIDDIRTVKGL